MTKSLKDKARKAAAKNVTATSGAKKMKGATTSKVTTKRRKTRTSSTVASTDTSVATSVNAGEEVAENVGGGSSSTTTETRGMRSTTSLDLGGEDLMDTTLHGWGGGLAAEPSTVALMPDVLDDETSSSKGRGAGEDDEEEARDGGDASPLGRRKGTLVPAFTVLWWVSMRCPRMRQRRIL